MSPVVQSGRRRPERRKLVVPAGYVGLESQNPPLRLLARLNDAAPELSDGLGGWDATARPQQVAMTTWKGNDPFTLKLSLMLDGWAGNDDVEAEIAGLYDVARGRDAQPGSVQVRGIPGLPADDWVITGIEPGDVIRRERDGRRLRQALELTLLEFNPPDWESTKKTALQGARARTHLVTIKHSPSKSDPRSRGETPAQLARRLKVKWTELRTLNPGVVRSANTALTPGTKIRAPLPDPKSSKARPGSRKGR